MLGFPLPLSTAPECLFCLLSLEYRKLKFVHIMLFALELWTRPPLTAFDVGPIVNGILIIIWSQLLCSTRGLQCTVFCLFARDRNRAFCHSACLPVDNDAARGSQVTMICGPPPWATVALCKSGSFIAQQITKLLSQARVELRSCNRSQHTSWWFSRRAIDISRLKHQIPLSRALVGLNGKSRMTPPRQGK